jgi:hypothetical protein
MHHIVIYHGNCTDGFAAFSIYYHWVVAHGHTATGYPVAPQDGRTWPTLPAASAEFSVAFLDVVPDEATLLKWEAAATATVVIDHHATSKEALTGHFPQKTDTVVQHSTDHCAAVLTYKWIHALASGPVPDWLCHVDRVDRWTDVTPHDLALRESLHAIAKIPVSNPDGTVRALALLNAFITRYSATGTGALELIAESEKLLAVKKGKVEALLSSPRRTSRVKVDPTLCTKTGLDPAWCGQVVFSIDTTGTYGFDSTLASYLVLAACPEVTVFVNYNQFADHRYKYCVRSREFDVTQGGLFKGHPCAAGGVLEGPTSPFLV